MKVKNYLLSMIVFSLIVSGCSTVRTHKLIVQGPEDITVKNLNELSRDACRAALREFGSIYSETSRALQIHNKFSFKACYKAKGQMNYRYIITITGENKDDLLVTIQTTSPDDENLTNLLYEELSNRGFKVYQIYD